MNPNFRPTAELHESNRSTGTVNSVTVNNPVASHETIRAHQAHAASPELHREPSLMTRLRTGLGVLGRLRISDLHTAIAFVRLKYPNYKFLTRWWLFTGWALRQAFWEIPRAMQCLDVEGRISNVPSWLVDKNPWANHPWATELQATLPAEVDTVVIGAGFTGAALAYHWSRRAPVNRSLAVLEMDDPASGSSGRNEGLVVMGRYFTTVRDTVHKQLDLVRNDLYDKDRHRLAEQFADRYCRAAYRNAELIETTIHQEQIECDYVREGWIQLREADEQSVLEESVRAAVESGYTDWTDLAPNEIYQRSGARVECPAGFSQAAASWHPAKWVWGLLKCALQSKKVSLFTRTKVVQVVNCNDHYEIRTERGTIRARHMVYATETYTPKLDRRLSGVILPVQEQAACGIGEQEQMPLRTTVSSSWWFAGRHGKKVVFGSGGPPLADEQAGRNRPSRFLTSFVASQMLRIFGPYKLRLTNEWSGSTGYTPDGYPIVGLLDAQKQYIIGGMSGSGSGVSFNAARCIVNRILGFNDEPDDYPPEYFAPSRLMDPKNHRWPQPSM